MLALLSLSVAAEGAQVAYTRSQWCGLADVVVVAEVTSAEVRWAEGTDGAIETVVWLAPKRTIKGSVPDPLALILPGGSLGDLSLWVEDTPRLALDRTYLFLLADAGPALVVLAGEGGAVPIALDGFDGEVQREALASLGACVAP